LFLSQVFYRDEKHSQSPQLAPDADGFIWMPEESFKCLLATCDGRTNRIVGSGAEANCAEVYSRASSKAAWRSKDPWFLIAEEDRMINPKTQQFMATRMGATTKSLAVDHTPLLSAPQEVVDIILEVKQPVSLRRNHIRKRIE
jgi:hypothetical protein